jgi:hypothetical protein
VIEDLYKSSVPLFPLLSNSPLSPSPLLALPPTPSPSRRAEGHLLRHKVVPGPALPVLRRRRRRQAARARNHPPLGTRQGRDGPRRPRLLLRRLLLLLLLSLLFLELRGRKGPVTGPP